MTDPTERGRTFARRATRSGLRRYPREVAASIRAGSVRSGPFARAARDSARIAALAAVDADRPPLAAAWLGHATVFVAIDGRLVLVDPVLSDRIGVRLGPFTVGMSRLEPAPVAPNDLPRADLILITHAHFDHLDRPTLRALSHPDTEVITARSTRRLIPRGFAAVHEVDWGQTVEAAGLRVSAHRPRHWGARTVVDRHRGYNAYVVDGPDRRALLAGDTAMTDAFDRLDEPARAPIDLAVFGIGAYDPWIRAHATPEQVWTMFRRSGARQLLPMHHSTFELSDEPAAEPLERLRAAAAADGQEARLVTPPVGAVWRDREREREPESEPNHGA